MDNPRPEKVAVVAEVKQRLTDTDAAVLTEYRGLDVPAMAKLRDALREAGAEYTIYKNSLVRFAAKELELDIDDLLVGPTAIAFVGERPDGTAGDAAALAKALRDFAKDNDHLVIKGGILDNIPVSIEDIQALADLPTRDQMYAEFAGAMESMFQDFAGLLDSKMREFSYGMQELLDKGTLGSGDPEAAAPAADEAVAEEAAPAEDAPAAEAAEETEAAADAAADETEASAAGEEASDDAGEETDAGDDAGETPTEES